MSNKTCENCGKEFDVIMASCGTSYTHMILKCPHCQHVHEERIYGSAGMLKMIEEDK
jgi:phage FluMu protein Com